MRFYCLVNGMAGAGKGARLLRILGDLSRCGVLNGDVVALNPEKFAEQMRCARSYDAILVAGGDGTVSRVAGALADAQIPIGVLPLGVGNDLAKELGVYRLFSPASPETLLAHYAKARTRRFSLGKIVFDDGQVFRFINYLSFGFDAAAVIRFSALRSRYPWIAKLGGRLGCLALYGWCGLVNITTRLPAALVVRDIATQRRVDAAGNVALIFSNLRSYTGLGKVSRSGSPFDDRIECSLIKSLAGYARIFLGTNQEWGSSLAGFEVELPAQGAPLQIDGEPMPHICSRRCLVTLEGAVSMLVPAVSSPL